MWRTKVLIDWADTKHQSVADPALCGADLSKHQTRCGMMCTLQKGEFVWHMMHS